MNSTMLPDVLGGGNSQASSGSDPFALILERPSAPRARPQFHVGKRTADFKRFFAFWIDLVEDPDLAQISDPGIYLRMMRDPQIYAAFTIRALATSSLPWHITPASDNPEARKYADWITGVFRNIPRWSLFVKNILTAIPHGISILEVLWDITNKSRLYPKNFFPVHKDRFVFTLQGDLALRSPIDPFWGEKVPDRTFLTHLFDQAPGSWHDPNQEGHLLYGLGLNDILYPTWLAKQIVLRMDLRYLGRFCTPTRIGRYPKHNNQAREAVQSLLYDLADDAVALFPSGEGYDLDHYEANGQGHRSFQELISYFDKAISKAYLGSTLLLDMGDVGSYSLGRVHERTTFGRIAEYDHQGVSSVFNRQLIPWIFELNTWNKEYMPKFEFSIKESHDINEIIESLRVAQEMGYTVTAEMLSEHTGLRMAKENETILKVNPESEENPIEVAEDNTGVMASKSVDQSKVINRREAYNLNKKLDALLQKSLLTQIKSNLDSVT